VVAQAAVEDRQRENLSKEVLLVYFVRQFQFGVSGTVFVDD